LAIRMRAFGAGMAAILAAGARSIAKVAERAEVLDQVGVDPGRNLPFEVDDGPARQTADAFGEGGDHLGMPRRQVALLARIGAQIEELEPFELLLPPPAGDRMDELEARRAQAAAFDQSDVRPFGEDLAGGQSPAVEQGHQRAAI